ncbi:hypothetical protein T231_03345 [Tannerella sp. oral taxon BU063 isolate Cell 6/7/9]|uniref:Uncharacterized protein n=1 Tax=Tannerella sp. oral taxon BU063 isolate Cell 6/7/9 TaxID=1411021 RepID=W2CUB3_9BACT|nr:hypothetical protein T231_03345 [Tannerella sp. oral taxon BU063 isolate Cell 6/7/9]
MRKESHDRARAEYIKHHGWSARLQLAWRLAGRIYFDDKYIGYAQAFCKAYDRYFASYGYDTKQIDAFCESVKSGITCKTTQRYSRFCLDMLRVTADYARWENVERFREESRRYMNNSNAPECNPQMVLRAAFRELEHALITLPRTTISKMETVADATHSS